MSLRNRLFLLVSAVVLLTVVLVTLTVSASARQSFATLDAERTAALVEQFRREFADQGLQVAERVDHVEVSAEREWAALVVGVRAFQQDVTGQVVTMFGLALPDSSHGAGHYHVGSAGDSSGAP